METTTKRIFVRCRDCLAVGAVDVEVRPHGYAGDAVKGLTCGCGGPTRFMGVVVKARNTSLDRLLTGVRNETPCDHRCTNARGPSCDCSCGGKNHGSGMVYRIEVTTGVPRIGMADPAKANEFRKACNEAKLRFKVKFGHEMDAPGWMGQEAYYARNRYLAARKLKTHKARLAKLAEVAA